MGKLQPKECSILNDYKLRRIQRSFTAATTCLDKEAVEVCLSYRVYLTQRGDIKSQESFMLEKRRKARRARAIRKQQSHGVVYI